MARNIFLIGFMGCGKSSVAEAMELEYGMKRIEMDQIIVEQNQMAISDIFKLYGEEHFRDLESALLEEVQMKENQVVSCGGGVVLRKKNVDIMRQNGIIILLTASPETILKRVENDVSRPVLEGKKTIQGIAGLMETRREKYEMAADVTIHTDEKSIAQICEEIQEKMRRIGE